MKSMGKRIIFTANFSATFDAVTKTSGARMDTRGKPCALVKVLAEYSKSIIEDFTGTL